MPWVRWAGFDRWWEVERATRDEGQRARASRRGPLQGVLGYETAAGSVTTARPARRSRCAVHAVVNGTQVKIYAWYDNEWGYVNRTAELVRLVGGAGR